MIRVLSSRRAIVALAVVGTLVALSGSVAPTASLAGAQTTTTVDTSPAPKGPGRIAYVTPSRDVVVADSDGSNARIVGGGAVANAAGLTPLAWRQPAADAITYVRDDGALVVAPVNGDDVQVLATDAVVPAGADENILSWDLSGSLLIYLAQATPTRAESRVVDLTAADEAIPAEIRTIGGGERRTVLAQAFSPLDPIIYQKTADAESGRALTVAIVEPFEGTITGTPYNLDDAVFTPDGKYLFAVSKGSGNVEQLVRITVADPLGVDLVSDHEQVCQPSVSPNSRKVVFAAGPNCSEVWTININGTDPQRIVERAGGDATFAVGAFSWSQDNAIVSHAACTTAGDGLDAVTTCGGGYLDISVADGSVQAGAEASSVLREFRALIRAVKVQVDITGPINYSGRLQVSSESVENAVKPSEQEVIDVRAVDETDNARSIDLRVAHDPDSVWVSGTLRIIDGDFDETFPFVGRVLPSSYGLAKMRGVWIRSESMPFQSGQLAVTFER